MATTVSFFKSSSLLMIVIILIGIAIGAHCLSADEMKKLEAIKLYKFKLDEQLTILKRNKMNLIALRDAQDVVQPYMAKINMDKVDFQLIVDESDSELIHVLQQEKQLAVKVKILENSISILSERTTAKDNDVIQEAPYVPKCSCFDMKTGEECLSGKTPTSLFSIEEFTIDGKTVKRLNPSYGYTPKTCREYLSNFYVGKVGNGFYMIKPSSVQQEFPVYCDMDRGGWIFLNGIKSMDSPLTQPVTPISPDITSSLEFQLLIELSQEIKSMLGDQCIIADKSQVESYHDAVMQYLCTKNGFSTPDSPTKFISFLHFWIR